MHLIEEIHGENVARFFDSLFIILQRDNLAFHIDVFE